MIEAIIGLLSSPAAIGVAGSVVGFAKGIKFIQEGQAGVVLRFGKAKRDKAGMPVISKPGFIFLIPFVDVLKRRHVRQQTQRFERQEVILADRLTITFGAAIMFRVVDVYSALFNVDDLDGSVSDWCMGILRDVLQNKDMDGIRDTVAISSDLLSILKETEAQWGVEFLSAKITSVSPTSGSAQILAMSARASALCSSVGFLVDQLDITTEKAMLLAPTIGGIPVATNASMPVPQEPVQKAKKS